MDNHMTTLPALIEKLRGLKWPDREVDAEIAAFVYGATISHGNLIHPDGCVRSVPDLTASLDAVVYLIEREGAWDWSIHRDNGEAIAGVQPASEDGCDCAGAHAPTPAIALLIAFLEAKMEIEE